MHINDQRALAGSIAALLMEYHRNPIYYLREAGLQARLMQLLHEALGRERADTRASIKQVELKREIRFVRASDRGTMARVQPEVRVQTEAYLQQSDTAKPAHAMAKSDLVLLRQASDEDPVVLSNYPNGPLDIVRLIQSRDIDAVIEIKAACSADPKMRQLFLDDVSKLLALQQQADTAVSVHFVLIDKSLAIGGHGHAPSARKGRPAAWLDISSDAGDLCIGGRLQQVPLDAPVAADGVHIWQLRPEACNADGPLMRHHLIAVR